MSRSVGVAVENSFVKGVVTEFSGLNFPENACTDALNVVFSEKGEVRRRPGIDWENDYAGFADDTVNDVSTSAFHWKTAGGKSENSFIVQQIGRYLHFFVTDSSLSSHKAPFEFDLLTYATDHTQVIPNFCQFANGSGRLYVTHPYSEPFYIEYDPDTNTISSSFYYVRIRDFTVLEDGIPPNQSTAAYIPNYQYNIYNAGWNDYTRNAWTGSRGYYPPKSAVWWYYRDQTGQGFDLSYNMSPARAGQFPEFGNALAPRGYYILNEFFQDRESASGIPGLPSKSSGRNRPSSVAFMNGRVFIAGVNAKGYNGRIYFSQILKDNEDELKFYQNGDPTSEINPQLLPNDGGVIVIPDAGTIIFMYQVKSSLMVFADNGVWSISGSEGIGFTATDYSIERISETPGLNAQSFAIVETTPIWWNMDGIYTVQGGQAGSLDVISITQNTIQTLYDAIPSENKKYAKAAYNRLTKEVFWLYSENEDDVKDYRKIMVFRVPTQAFYFYETLGAQELRDIVPYTGAGSSTDLVPVYDNTNENVLDENDELVTITVNIPNSTVTNIKFLTAAGTNNYTYSDFLNVSHVDWTSSGLPVEFSSYFISGYRLRGEGQKKSQIGYVTIHSKFVEDNSCFVRAIWDYRHDVLTGGVSNEQQVCKASSGVDYNTRRLKIRGSGISCQFHFFSEGSKPFTVTGWATSESVNDRV